ncbi:MAG: hypothetical protein LBQ74_20175 [Prevotella sp.]|jgi:hypothetical protein|nr:hypothetical protein [Prevotella sp.]
MATSKLNAEQFAAQGSNFKGIILVYTAANGAQTAQHFFGADYEIKSGLKGKAIEDEKFRVWRNVVMTFWSVKAEELKLREDNDGIRSKLRATTPSSIIFHDDKGNKVVSYQLDQSVWAKIGLVPTKKDFERTARDFKKAIHAATKASFDALGFRVDLNAKGINTVDEVLNKVAQEVQAENAVPADKQLEKAAA